VDQDTIYYYYIRNTDVPRWKIKRKSPQPDEKTKRTEISSYIYIQVLTVIYETKKKHGQNETEDDNDDDDVARWYITLMGTESTARLGLN